MAAALGTTRQAAWRRYRNVDPPERYGIRISERAARRLTKGLIDSQPGLHEVVVVDGRDPSSGERVSKKVSLHALSIYLMPFPEAAARDLRLIPMLDD